LPRRPEVAPTTEKRRVRVHPGDVLAHDHGDRRSGASVGGSDIRYAPVVAQKAGTNTSCARRIHARALSGGRQGGKAGRSRQGVGGGKAHQPTAAPAIGRRYRSYLCQSSRSGQCVRDTMLRACVVVTSGAGYLAGADKLARDFLLFFSRFLGTPHKAGGRGLRGRTLPVAFGLSVSHGVSIAVCLRTFVSITNDADQQTIDRL
jgi:hypothetical protein